MIANLMAAYRESIATLDWMGAETRREALAKLAAIAPEDRLSRPHGATTARSSFERDDLVGNVMRARRFDYAFWLAKLGGKVDRAEWCTTPQTVNAFYSPSRNEIVFPAGILQPPFFDAGADDAANYGGIGTVIGHEISHAFDDQGSRFDGEGNLRNWWTEDDRSRFEAKTRSLVAQYDAFSPLPGYHVNGALTLGRERRRQCRPCDRRAGLSARRSAAARRRSSTAIPASSGCSSASRRSGATRCAMPPRIERLKVDPHSPGQFRANGSLRNQAAFDNAFDVKPGDAMYLPPEQRISLWQTDREMECKAKDRKRRVSALRSTRRSLSNAVQTLAEPVKEMAARIC